MTTFLSCIDMSWSAFQNDPRFRGETYRRRPTQVFSQNGNVLDTGSTNPHLRSLVSSEPTPDPVVVADGRSVSPILPPGFDWSPFLVPSLDVPSDRWLALFQSDLEHAGRVRSELRELALSSRNFGPIRRLASSDPALQNRLRVVLGVDLDATDAATYACPICDLTHGCPLHYRPNGAVSTEEPVDSASGPGGSPGATSDGGGVGVSTTAPQGSPPRLSPNSTSSSGGESSPSPGSAWPLEMYVDASNINAWCVLYRKQGDQTVPILRDTYRLSATECNMSASRRGLKAILVFVGRHIHSLNVAPEASVFSVYAGATRSIFGAIRQLVASDPSFREVVSHSLPGLVTALEYRQSGRVGLPSVSSPAFVECSAPVYGGSRPRRFHEVMRFPIDETAWASWEGRFSDEHLWAHHLVSGTD